MNLAAKQMLCNQKLKKSDEKWPTFHVLHGRLDILSRNKTTENYFHMLIAKIIENMIEKLSR